MNWNSGRTKMIFPQILIHDISISQSQTRQTKIANSDKMDRLSWLNLQ